jgi:predicted transcriptional regulator
MDILWQGGESTVRQVAERLRAQGADVAYTTVLTLMTRLARRGLLVRRRLGRADLYRVAVERDELGAALLREAVGRLLEAHGEAALAAFADRLREGDPAQLARLRALLEADRT